MNIISRFLNDFFWFVACPPGIIILPNGWLKPQNCILWIVDWRQHSLIYVQWRFLAWFV